MTEQLPKLTASIFWTEGSILRLRLSLLLTSVVSMTSFFMTSSGGRLSGGHPSSLLCTHRQKKGDKKK